MQAYLTYLFLLIAPFLFAIHFLFTLLLFPIVIKLKKIKLDLPIFLFSFFIIYDWLALILLNMDIKFNPYIFQGWMLLLIFAYILKFNLLFIKYIFYFLLLVSFNSFYGLLNGASILSIIAFLKNLLILPFLLHIEFIVKNKFTNFKFLLILFVFCFSIVIDNIQSIYGFKEFFLKFGYDLFYFQRGISNIGELPIGISTQTIFGENTNRMFGLFLSPDKTAYVVYLIEMILFLVAINKFNIFITIIFALLFIIILYMFQVKAILLNMLIFFFSYYLYKVFNIKSLSMRFFISICIIIAVSIFAFFSVGINYLSASGAIQHVWGLFYPVLQAITDVKLFLIGHGIGTGGTLGGVSNAVEGLSKTEKGGESFIGSVVFQMGILGVMFYMYVIKKIDEMYLHSISFEKYILFSSLLLGIFISSMFSEPVLSIFQVSCYLLLVQFILNYNK